MTSDAYGCSLYRLLWVCLLCFGLGCSKGTPRVASDLEAEIPTGLRADYMSFVDNCSKCHGLERPLTANVTETRHWDLYVSRMMRTAGSAISASESPKILRFLYWYTERKMRLGKDDNKAAKEHAAVAEETSSGAQRAGPDQAAAAQAREGAPAPAIERKSDLTTAPAQDKPAQDKPGESAP